MIKLFFAMFTLFSLNSKQFDVEIKDIEKTNIVYSCEGLKLVEEDNLDLYKDNLLIYSFEKNSKITWTNYNYHLLVSVLKDGKLNIYQFDSYNRLINKKEFSNRYNTAVLKNINEELILIGEITYYQDQIFKDSKKEYFDKSDAFIARINEDLEFEKVKTYGGQLNEGFIDIKFDNNFYYLVVLKDSLSGGDFGNTYSEDKTYLLCKLDMNFNLASFVSFKEKYIGFEIYQDCLYFMSSSTLYQLDFHLNLIFSRKISEECIFSHFTPNYSLVTINGLEGQIFNLSKMTETKFALSSKPLNVVIYDEGFLINSEDKSTHVFIYDLSNFKKDSIYLEEVGKVNNLFRDLEVISKDYNISFNPLVHGTYEVTYLFKDYKINGNVSVLKETNVSNDIIYPIGYKLKFTGIAYLDNELINNNHQVTKTGLHELKLIDNIGQFEIINFYIDDQIKFIEPSSKFSDLEVYPYQEFNFIISIDNPYNYQIESFVVNQEEYYNFKIEEDKIILSFIEDVSGIYEYQISKVNFKNESLSFSLDCFYKYNVTVLNNNLTLDSSFSNTNSELIYHSNVSDIDATIRGFKVIITNNGEELSYNYAIKDCDIDLKYINMASSTVRINLVIYEGGNSFNELELFSLKIKPNSNIVNLGSIDIVSSGESLEEFRLLINKSEITEVLNNEKTIFIKEEDNSLTNILIASIIGVISFIIIFVFRKKKA